LRQLSQIAKPRGQQLIDTLYPDDGPFRRELYAKHLEFFRLGAEHRERGVMGGNRVGKTRSLGGYELALHLTGEYPEWWEGRRFETAIDAWAAGDTGQTTRDIIQDALLGPAGDWGSGLIPQERIDTITRKAGGVPDAVEGIRVHHASGGVSRVGLKSYDQGRRSFQGTFKHVVWLDEEPPWLVYAECKLRTTATDASSSGGVMMTTFTPLLGMSDVARYFLRESDDE
jgi:phage terminase large subunit-like protein